MIGFLEYGGPSATRTRDQWIKSLLIFSLKTVTWLLFFTARQHLKHLIYLIIELNLRFQNNRPKN